MTGALSAAAWLVASTSTKKSSSGLSPIILIYAVIGVGFYFLYYRPRKRKAQEAREQANAWDVGDEVLTAGGIVGYIIDIDGDRVTLETSVGASFVVLKQYILRKIEEVPDEPSSDEDLYVDEEEFDDETGEETEDHLDDEEDHSDGESLDTTDEESGDDISADDGPGGRSGGGGSGGPGAGNRRSRRSRNQSAADRSSDDDDGQPAA